MATRYQGGPRERERMPSEEMRAEGARTQERIPEEALRLEPMIPDRDFEKLYGMRSWLRDRVRLAPVFAGLFVALATNLSLLTFGIWVGLITSAAPTGGVPIGLPIGGAIWLVVSAWLSLLLGGWYTAHMSGVAGRMDGILNGVALWGLFVTASLILGSFSALLGVGSLVTVTIGGGGTLDLLRALNLSSLAAVAPEQAAAITTAVSAAAAAVWVFTALGAGFAILGGWLGARSRRVNVRPGSRGEITGAGGGPFS